MKVHTHNTKSIYPGCNSHRSRTTGFLTIGAGVMAQEGVQGVKFLYSALPALGGAAAPTHDVEPTSMPFRGDVITLDDAEPDELASKPEVHIKHAMTWRMLLTAMR